MADSDLHDQIRLEIGVQGIRDIASRVADDPGAVDLVVAGIVHMSACPTRLFVKLSPGLSAAQEDGGPAIIVNTWERLPVETWIFSAAHELGHLLLHLSAYDAAEEQEDREQEQQADQFASHFLMPEVIFRKEWDDTAGLPLVDRVLKVKRVFRMSWRTVLYRIAQWQPQDRRSLVWQRFNEEYRLRKGRSLLKHDEPYGITREIYQDPMAVRPAGVEPAPMEQHDFQMDRLSRLVRKAIGNEVISLSRGAEILRLSLKQMRELSASWIA